MTMRVRSIKRWWTKLRKDMQRSMDAQIRALMLYMKHHHDHDLDFAHFHHHHHYQILNPNSNHTLNEYNTNDRIYVNPNPNPHAHHSHYTKKSYVKLGNNMARLGRSDREGQCESARCRALIRRLRMRVPTSCLSPAVCVGAVACERSPPLNLLYDPISYALNFGDAPNNKHQI